MKVDFGDFNFVYIKPKVIRYVSGIATASLGSGGLSFLRFPFSFAFAHKGLVISYVINKNKEGT